MAATHGEVRLRKGSSLQDRLFRASLGVLVLLFAVPGIMTWDWADQIPSLAAVLALPLGGFLIVVAAIESNIAWIVTCDGIVIGEQRPLGQVRKRFIGADDVSELQVRKASIGRSHHFSLACKLASGVLLISPPLPDITRINETSTAVARLLGLPDVAAVDNPLEATNAEMRLGEPVSPGRGRLVRVVVVAVAGVCGLLVAAALWQDDVFSAYAIVLWSLGLIVALGFYKYVHRLAGLCWIIRHGEIRVERIALTGRYHADTITSGDVDSVEIERGNSKGDRHLITIGLRTGHRFRSTDITGDDNAGAVRAEIIRRLKIESRTNSR